MDQDVIELYRDLGRQADAIREQAAHIHAGEARLAEMVADFTADPRWNDGDWRSIAHWLVVNCGYTVAEANAIAKVAEKSAVMPTVMDHARAGEVSIGVAAMAARVAVPEIDEHLAQIVTTATPNQVARVLSKYRDLKPKPDVDAEPAPSPDDYWWRTWFDDTGNGHLDAKLPTDVLAALDEAYAAARRSCERDRLTADELDDDTTRTPIPVVETVARLAAMVLDNAGRTRLTRPGGEPFRVTIEIDLDTFTTGTLRVDSTCRFRNGPDVTPDLVRRLAEENTVELLFHRDGVPLNLGREFRLASREQRRALRFRDGGCAVPGCSVTHYLHVHHVVYWEHGGLTDLDNLVLLCPWHHRLVHHHGWSILAHGNQRFTFFDRHGRIVGNRHVHTRRDGRAPPGQLAELPEHAELDIGPHTATPIGAGERLTDFGTDVWLHTLLTAASSDDHLVAA